MKNLLKNYFGYDSFLPLQEEIITHVMAGKDALVLMPTGGGKSICYQLPAMALSGVTLVISPLIALMKDQVDQLKTNGIAAEFINSSIKSGEIREIQDKVKKGEIKILYVAPERLPVEAFRDFLGEIKIALIAIDEAHCISEWGHDFRPDYRNLTVLKEMFPKVPVIALTATATDKVRADIVERLNIKKAKVFVSGFNRPNLTYIVKPKNNAYTNLVELLKKYEKKSAIIYCFSRKETEEIAKKLRKEKIKALPYHAGLASEKRQETQEKFIRDEIEVIVATIAFGMGINKPDVRLVVHYSLPKSVEGYYQETGRAGRDGLPSECVLFYSYADSFKQEFFFKEIENEEERQRARTKLQQMIDYCESDSCRREYLLRYFGEKPESECQGCDVCLSPKEKIDATIIGQKILSAVGRTEERFGVKYVCDVLRGVKDKRIKDLGHDKLSVFGICAEMSEDELKYYFNQLLSKGLLQKSEGKYATIMLGEKGREFLRLKQKLLLPRPELKMEIKIKKNKKAGVENYDEELFEELRIIRKLLADKFRVPPYIVFGDVTLKQMAYYRPQTEEAMLEITGVGHEKLKKFGADFLGKIQRYEKKKRV